MRSPSRDRGPSSLPHLLRSPQLRRVIYFAATLGAFACSFPERTFIPADEFDKMKAAGGTAGTAGSAGTGATGATGAMGGSGGSAGTSGGTAGISGSGGEGGVAGTAGTSGAGGSAGAAGTGATGGATTGGSAGNMTGGTGGMSGAAGTGGTGGSGTTNGLIFSEYVEGSALNKALEIYNSGSANVDLADCHLEKYLNAGTSAETIVFSPANVLAPGGIFVICNAGITDTSECDQTTSGTSTGISHNGNEAYVLTCSGVIEDSIGQVGSNISSKWGTDPISTLDHTLRRDCSVMMGDTDPNDAYDPANDSWQGFDKDDLSDLGKHCGN